MNATDATHVQATLQFARDHNLKVNINNTGHAGPGRYVADVPFELDDKLLIVSLGAQLAVLCCKPLKDDDESP